MACFRRSKKDKINEALKRFILLEGTDKQCGYTSYLILAQNYKIALEERKGKQLPSGSPVMSEILRHLDENARECMPKYGKLFDEEFAKMNPHDTLTYLDHIFGEGKDELIFFLADDGTSPSLTTDDVLSRNFHTFKVYDRDMIETVKQRLGTIQKSISDPGRINERVYLIYLVDKCKDLADRMKHIFAPARFAAMSTNSLAAYVANSEHQHGASEEFLKRWKQYRTCLAYLEADRSRIVYINH